MQELNGTNSLTMGRRLSLWLLFYRPPLTDFLGWSGEKAKTPAPQPEKILQQMCDLRKSAPISRSNADVTKRRWMAKDKG